MRLENIVYYGEIHPEEVCIHMREHKKQSPLTLLLMVLLVLLLITAVALTFPVCSTCRHWEWESSITQSPVPPYASSMMQVTIDPSAPTPVPTMRIGSQGEDVRQLQQRLLELGYYTGEVDGQFGQGTDAAVKRFQQQHGLDADGIVGESTREQLYAGSAQPAPATVTPSAAPAFAGQGATTSDVQRRLKELGYYTGDVDGIAGPATTAAVKHFQRQHGLDVDGIVGPATLAALFADNAQRAVATPTPEPWSGGSDVPGVLRSGAPMVVNREVYLPDQYQPYELVNMSTYCDSSIVTIKYSGTQAERIAVDALMAMLRDAHAQGLTVWQVSAAYRSIEEQQKLFDDKVYEFRQQGFSGSKARSAASRTVADPGSSEHHLGLAFDVTVPGKFFIDTQQSRWLAENCWDYGFVIRYQEDKINITGYEYEPWHIRYVGTQHSLIMRDEHLCLEEYLQKYWQ